jgi:hypothetical protein
MAPLGWVVDGSKQSGSLARMYERGRTQEEAIRSGEFMYINFWTKIEGTSDLQNLLDHQKKYLEEASVARIKLVDGIRSCYKTLVRYYTRLDYPNLIEITGFVEYEDFILMCVLLGPPARQRENLRRVRFVMESALSMKVEVVNTISPTDPASPQPEPEHS